MFWFWIHVKLGNNKKKTNDLKFENAEEKPCLTFRLRQVCKNKPKPPKNSCVRLVLCHTERQGRWTNFSVYLQLF